MTIKQTPEQGHTIEYVDATGKTLVRAEKNLHNTQWALLILDGDKDKFLKFSAAPKTAEAIVLAFGKAFEAAANTEVVHRVPRSVMKLTATERDAKWQLNDGRNLYWWDDESKRWWIEGSGIKHRFADGFEPFILPGHGLSFVELPE